MTDINQLSTSDTLTAGDLLPVWRTNNSDTRKTSLSTLASYINTTNAANLTTALITPTNATSQITIGNQFKERVNVKHFGALVDTATDDVAALSRIAAAYPNGGIRIVIPGDTGYMRINSGWTAPAGFSNVDWEFLGQGTLYNPSHGFDFITLPVNVGGHRWLKPKFFTDSGASGATERFFFINNSDDLIVTDFWGLNAWSGIKVTGARNYFNGTTYLSGIKPASGRFIFIEQGSKEIVEFHNIYGENAPASDALYGVHITSASAAVIRGTIAKGGTPLLVAPGNGQVVATLALEFNCDTSAQNGATFTSSGTGVVQRVEGFLRVSSNAGNGAQFLSPPRSSVLTIRAVDNGVRGVQFAGFDYQNSAFFIYAYGNNTHGWEMEGGANRITIQSSAGFGDDFGTNTQYGGVIGVGCDNFTIDLDGDGGAVGQLFNGAGTSATRVVTTRV